MSNSRKPIMTALLAGSVLLTACSKPVPPEPQPRPVRVSTVQYRQTVATVRYSGDVRARYDSPLAFQVGGKLLKRQAEVGSRVVKGQLLATLDQADVRLDEAGAAAELAAAQAELDLARKDLRHLGNLQIKELASQAAVERRQDQVKAAEARVSAARATQMARARKYGYAELRADHDGVITTVDAEPDQIVSAGQSIFRLARTNEKEAVISIPENHLQDLQAATGIRVSLWADPDRYYTGKLREVSPGVDQVLRTYTAKVTLLDADDSVNLGMTATVHVQKDEPQPVAWLPLTALTQINQQPAVWIYDPATQAVQPHPVTLAGYEDDHARLLAGVAEGDRVVTAGVHKLVAGQKVRLLEVKP